MSPQGDVDAVDVDDVDVVGVGFVDVARPEGYAVAERERIFGTQWFAAAHVAELANPGDVKLVEFGDTSIIL